MFRTLLSTFFVLTSACASAQTASVLTDRIARVDASTRLDDTGLKPWSLAFRFRLLDGDGHTTDEGTVDEVWGGGKRVRRVVKSKGYSAVYMRNEAGSFQSGATGGLPYLLELLIRQMVHPMPKPEEIAGLTPHMLKPEKGAVQADCIMLQPAKDVEAFQHIGVFPTYCLEPGKDLLLASYDYSTLTISRDGMGTFQHRVIPTEISVLLNRVKVAEAHLVSLKTGVEDKDFQPEAGMQEIHESTVVWKDGMPYPERIYAPNVHAPGGILTAHSLTAPVEIMVRVGPDGIVHGLRLLHTPDFRITDTGLEAVSRWRYKSYLVSGQAVTVEFPVYFRVTDVLGIHINAR